MGHFGTELFQRALWKIDYRYPEKFQNILSFNLLDDLIAFGTGIELSINKKECINGSKLKMNEKNISI